MSILRLLYERFALFVLRSHQQSGHSTCGKSLVHMIWHQLQDLWSHTPPPSHACSRAPQAVIPYAHTITNSTLELASQGHRVAAHHAPPVCRTCTVLQQLVTHTEPSCSHDYASCGEMSHFQQEACSTTQRHTQKLSQGMRLLKRKFQYAMAYSMQQPMAAVHITLAK